MPNSSAANTSCPRSGRFWLLELRYFSDFSRPVAAPASQAMDTPRQGCQHFCPRSGRFWLLELRDFSDFS